jgi:hypothetical protein
MQVVKKTARKSWEWYDRYRTVLTPAYFLIGFSIGYGNRRIDLWEEQIILLTHLALAAVCLVVYHQFRSGRLQNSAHRVYLNWYRGFGFFFIGGLFTRHVTYFFQSSAGIKSAAFITALFLIVLLGEALKRKIPDWYLQWTLFYLGLFSFMIFFLPIVTHEMNPKQFVLSGAISFILTIVLILSASVGIQPAPFWKTVPILIVLHTAMTLAYFMNWIPPVPLALKHAGIYHRVEKNDGSYRLFAESARAPWLGPVPYHYLPGDTVFCFTAVFAPTQMNKTIFHEWSHYDERNGEWRLVDRLRYPLTGGRDGGYRGFTAKSALEKGLWQIDIVTEDDLLIGSVRFDMRPARSGDRTFITINR